MVALNHWI